MIPEGAYRLHIKRTNAARVLSERMMRLGGLHPATWAALAQAHRLWGGFVRPIRIDGLVNEHNHASLAEAYTTADLRAAGAEGWNNRAMRRARRRRCDDQACTNNLIDLLPRGVMPGGTRMPA